MIIINKRKGFRDHKYLISSVLAHLYYQDVVKVIRVAAGCIVTEINVSYPEYG